MITFVRYESLDGRRLASIERKSERSWAVKLTERTATGCVVSERKFVHVRLTSAQGAAREWVNRGVRDV